MILRGAWWIVVVSGTIALCGCVNVLRSPENRRATTDSYMRVLRDGIGQFTDSSGHLPDSLLEICPSLDGADCHWLPPGYTMVDGWDRGFEYVRRDGDYELRSAGPDGELGTEDDIVFSQSWEREQVAAISGCYEVEFDWWKEFANGHLVLDTTEVAIGQFEAGPEVPNYLVPHWTPLWPDLLRASWYEIHHSVQLTFRFDGDSLVGAVEEGGGLGGDWPGGRPSRPLVAYRVPCLGTK